MYVPGTTHHLGRRGANPRTLHMNHRQRALSYFRLAANNYQQACYAQAIQHYLAGLEFDPMRVEVYADLAKAYEMLGYWSQALEYLEIALRLRPGYPTAQRRKKRILEEKRVYEDLIDELNLDQTPSDTQFLLQNQPERSSMSVVPRIEGKFFTLTYADTISQKLLMVIYQLIERTYHDVGKIFQCYPQHKVPISIEAVNKDSTHQASYEAKYSEDAVFTSSLSTPTAPLPLWVLACYDGGIRLAHRPYDDSGVGILYSVLRHEWVHLLVDLLAQGRCPNWLDEGLAQSIARPLINSEEAILRQASRNRQLLPLGDMQKPFSQISTKLRRLAYLQSRAMVEYLVQQFGISHIRALLNQIGAGKPLETAFREVFDKTEEEIVAVWRIVL